MSGKIYHTVVRVQSKLGVIKYERVEDEYYETARYYEKYFTNGAFPDNYDAVVINQFVTEEDED